MEQIFFQISIETDRFLLKTLDSEYYKSVTKYLKDNRLDFTPYLFKPTKEFFTEKFQKSKMRYEEAALVRMDGFRLYIIDKNTEINEQYFEILGDISVFHISDKYKEVTIGYKTAIKWQRKGVMREAILGLLVFLKEKLHTKQVLAYIMPDNQPSIKLIKAVGFEEIEYIEKFLEINFKMEDHIKFEFKIE